MLITNTNFLFTTHTHEILVTEAKKVDLLFATLYCTSRLCCASYTGSRCSSASCSRSRRSSTSRCAVTLRSTSSTTVSWSPMYAAENCVLLTLECSLSTGPAAVLATGRSLLLRLEYGTVCRLTWENWNCHTASSGGLWRHFYSDSETTAHCELLNCTA